MRIKITLIVIILIILPFQAGASLTFGGSSVDNVNFGSAGSIDNMDPFTYVAWFYATALPGTAEVIIGKSSAVANYLRLTSGVPGEIECSRARGAGGANNSTYISNNASVTTDKWYFVACTFNSANGQPVHIYLGDLTTSAKELSYGTAQVGTGSVRDDSADNLAAGNASPNGGTVFKGRIAGVMVIKSELTLGQIKQLQYNMSPVANTVIYSQLGYGGGNGATQPDWSGFKNNGTASTTGSVAPHVPIGAPSSFAVDGSNGELAQNPSTIDRMLALRDSFTSAIVAFAKKIKSIF